VAYFKVVSFGGIEGDHGDYENTGLHGRDPNRAPTEYRAQELPLEPSCSVSWIRQASLRFTRVCTPRAFQLTDLLLVSDHADRH